MCYVRQSGKPKEPRLGPTVYDGFTCASTHGPAGRLRYFLPHARRTLTKRVHPYLIHFGHIVLPTFGLLAAIGLMAALGLSERCARLVGLDAERLWDAGLFAIVAAFVLSRALLVAQNWHTFLNFPILLLAVPSLTPTGVLLSGAATLVYLRWKRVPMLRALDAWAAPATLIWAALALGHFFEGSDPGLPTRSFAGMRSAGQSSPHHPVSLYAAAVALALTAWAYRRLRQERAAGRAAGWTLVLAGASQFLLSFLREPGVESLLGLDALQWVALVMIACGGLLVAFALGKDPLE